MQWNSRFFLLSIDQFFPRGYKKLALHFVVNDLTCAQKSVDLRMVKEILLGVEAKTTMEIINTNKGGPYGSEVLPGKHCDMWAVLYSITLNF